MSKTLLNKLSRRGFIAGAGSVAAATALAGCADDGTVTLPAVNTVTDNDILNFALNLEYLEAEFYLRAATGSGLAAADTGGGTAPIVPPTIKVPTTTTAQTKILNELAYTEQQHVRFLRSTLGAAAVARPQLNFTDSFASIASAAGLPSSFNPFGDFNSFVTVAAVFEDIGVTAYNGAAPLLSSTTTGKTYLAAAAGIMSVEAYHGATLRGYLFAQAATLGTTAFPYLGYFNQVQGVISTLSSGYGTLNLQGVTSGPLTVGTGVGATSAGTGAQSVPNVVPADSNAPAFHRTTDQVLHIAYGSLGGNASTAGVSKGGFFPVGFNGNIKTTAS